MKPQIATTIEQSRRLLDCGVDPKTADTYWCFFIETEPFLCLGEIPVDNETGEIMNEGDIPAWSLSALCSLLPESIFNTEKRVDCQIMIVKHPNFGYRIAYSGLTQSLKDATLFLVENDSLIEACVQMIEFLTANGYSLNKIEK